MTLKIHPKAGGFVEIQLDPSDLDFEAVCPGATGEGCVLGRNRAGQTCSTCNGRGVVLTPMGLHILDFVLNRAAERRTQLKKFHADKK